MNIPINVNDGIYWAMTWPGMVTILGISLLGIAVGTVMIELGLDAVMSAVMAVVNGITSRAVHGSSGSNIGASGLDANDYAAMDYLNTYDHEYGDSRDFD